MDVISLGKAKKVLREMEAYHNKILGENAESYFPSVDARLDYLEKQLSIKNIQRTVNLLNDTASMSNLEFKDGKLKLIYQGLDEAGNQLYAVSGVYEKIFDVGPSILKLLANVLTVSKAANHTVTTTIAESDNGTTFGTAVAWTAAYVPKKRFIKVRIVLTSNATFQSRRTTIVELEENKFTKNKTMVKSYGYNMELDNAWIDQGSVYRKLIPKNEIVRIDTMVVK